ncbi:RNA-directed DNA polymerase from mobile element jockey-like protein, partial [Dinothrombium tinctorium]
IPKQLKSYTITPVLKSKKDPLQLENYRPVSVQNNILKIFEKLLLNNLESFVCSNKLIPSSQYGFSKVVSISFQIIDLIDFICTARNDPHCLALDMIFVDFSDAYLTPTNSNITKVNIREF